MLNIKKFCSGFLAVLIYFMGSLFSSTIYNILYPHETNLIFETIHGILYEIILLCLIILVLKNDIVDNYNDFKKNHKKYLSQNFKYYLIGLAIMYISNAINIFIFKNGLSGNETTIRDMLGTNTIYVYISGVLLAPIMEELVFRQGFRNMIKNDFIFIITSGLIFGSLHIFSSYSGLSDLLYLIPYCSLGIAFSYILTKTKNIFTTTTIHTMHNGLLISLQILISIFTV